MKRKWVTLAVLVAVVLALYGGTILRVGRVL